MKIKRVIEQNRRDFLAIYVCEGCGNEEQSGGYDDANFHVNVIPNLKCRMCAKSGKEIGAEYQPMGTKYPEGVQV